MKTTATVLATIALMAMTLAGKPAGAANEDVKVSISAAGSPIERVLQEMTQLAEIEFLLEPGASGSVTVNLERTPLEAALGAITRSAGLEWSRLLVPKDASPRQIQDAFNAVRYAPKASIVVDASPTQPAAGVLTGKELEAAWKQPSALGMKEVYWVHRPRVIVAEPEEKNPAEQTQPDQESASPENVYRSVTKSLSALPPEQAYALLMRVTDEVVAALEPGSVPGLTAGLPVEPSFLPPPPPLQGPIRLTPGPSRPTIRMGAPGFDPVLRYPGFYYWPY
ncbi:MAG: hypothetical protein KatS3mg024_2066 [Armatimonadota bacterium]|nr:MAG: hypothetical protein KatS3mg024_2066 [Armatimonadota bacterium]